MEKHFISEAEQASDLARLLGSDSAIAALDDWQDVSSWDKPTRYGVNWLERDLAEEW